MNNPIVFHSSSPEETESFAGRVAKNVQKGDVLALYGKLSAGKTTFARGFASGLGIEEPVTSPSFPIIQEYECDPMFYHMDWYRLSNEDDIFETGALELLESDGISLIEWPQRGESLLPDSCIRIHINPGDDQVRSISLDIPEDRRGEFENVIHEE